MLGHKYKFITIILASIMFSGCVNFRVIGGPKKIDRKIAGTAFLQEAEHLVKNSDNAMFALRQVRRKQITASALTITCSVLALGGSLFSIFASGETPLLATGITLSVTGVGVCIAGVIMAPKKSDYARILLTYNGDFPHTPYWSPELDISRPSRR